MGELGLGRVGVGVELVVGVLGVEVGGTNAEVQEGRELEGGNTTKEAVAGSVDGVLLGIG